MHRLSGNSVFDTWIISKMNVITFFYELINKINDNPIGGIKDALAVHL